MRTIFWGALIMNWKVRRGGLTTLPTDGVPNQSCEPGHPLATTRSPIGLPPSLPLQVWTAAQAVNFTYVPVKFRPLFGSCVALWWNIYLSLSSAKGKPSPAVKSR